MMTLSLGKEFVEIDCAAKIPPHSYTYKLPQKLVRSQRSIKIGKLPKRFFNDRVLFVFEVGDDIGIAKLRAFKGSDHIKFNRRGKAHVDVKTKADKHYLFTYVSPWPMKLTATGENATLEELFDIIFDTLKQQFETPVEHLFRTPLSLTVGKI